jgi:outer membrane protein
MSTISLAGRSLLVLAVALAAPLASAQQKLGYIDSNRILERLPDYQTVQQDIERTAQQWQAEVAALDQEVATMEADFAARQLLYTPEESTLRQGEVDAKRTQRDALRTRYFGPEGELFREQQNRLRPVQERVLAAVEAVATDGDYDYVFDRSGDFVFLYTRARYDLTDLVLDELGVGVGATTGAGR